MLVRKLRDEWKPSENKDLQIGEIIDITDPRYLIETGMVEKVEVAVRAERLDVEVEEVNYKKCSKCGKEFRSSANRATHEKVCKG